MEKKLAEIKKLWNERKKLEDEKRRAIHLEKNEEKADEIQYKIWEIEGRIEFYLDNED